MRAMRTEAEKARRREGDAVRRAVRDAANPRPKCIHCGVVIRSDSKTGYCIKHRHLAPEVRARANAHQNAAYAANPQKKRDQEKTYRDANKPRIRQLRKARTYGLSEAEALVADRVEFCQATGRPIESPQYRAVDHSHEHGHVRGVLHTSINTALGLFGDDPAALRAAADYLERTARPGFKWEESA